MCVQRWVRIWGPGRSPGRNFLPFGRIFKKKTRFRVERTAPRSKAIRRNLHKSGHTLGHTQALGKIQARSKARSQARSNQQLLLRPLPVAFCSNQGSGRAHACFLTHRALASWAPAAAQAPLRSGCQNCDPVASCPACAPGGQGIWDVPGRVPDHVHAAGTRISPLRYVCGLV